MATELKREGALSRVEELLGGDAQQLLEHTARGIPKEHIQVPGPDFVDRVWAQSDRNPRVLRSLQTLFNTGRLAGTGYLSIFPVDQGIEHSAGASFAPNPQYFDPQNIVRLAIEGGCNAVASTFGVLGSVARRYAHKIPFIVKINHNELLTYPNKFDQVLFGTVDEARDMGAIAVGVTIQADIIKQKLPERNGGYLALNIESSYGKTNKKVYEELTSDNPIDLVRYQVANGYMGRVGLINSGGESKGQSDMAEAVRTAVINKRGGGMGLISGRKAFQRPIQEGVQLLNAIQDVYLAEEITVA